MNEHLLEAFEYNQHLVAYLNIVNYWKSHKAEGDVERHHIVPKSFFKNTGLPVDDSEDNIVTLPYEDHQKIHSLAVLCAKEIIKASMKYANNMMHNRKSMVGDNNPKYWKGKTRTFSVETCKKMSETRKGKPKSAEWCKKHSEAMKGKTEQCRKMIEARKFNYGPMLGKHHSEEAKQKIREARARRKANTTINPV